MHTLLLLLRLLHDHRRGSCRTPQRHDRRGASVERRGDAQRAGEKEHKASHENVEDLSGNLTESHSASTWSVGVVEGWAARVERERAARPQINFQSATHNTATRDTDMDNKHSHMTNR